MIWRERPAPDSQVRLPFVLLAVEPTEVESKQICIETLPALNVARHNPMSNTSPHSSPHFCRR
jgi:hypothetical protein